MYIYRCKSPDSRVSAYEVLVELATGCPENMEKIAKQLLSMHHYVKPELSKEYEVCFLIIYLFITTHCFSLSFLHIHYNILLKIISCC